MIYPKRLTPNLIWLALILLFAMVIVRPDVSGISHIALLCGWLSMIVVLVAEFVLVSECIIADISEDKDKRARAIDFLRKVTTKLADAGKFRRIRGDVKLYTLALLIAFTGNVFLALMFIICRLLRAMAKHTADRVIEEHDAKANTRGVGDTDHAFTPSTATTN
jgi:cation transport ATPase